MRKKTSSEVNDENLVTRFNITKIQDRENWDLYKKAVYLFIMNATIIKERKIVYFSFRSLNEVISDIQCGVF